MLKTGSDLHDGELNSIHKSRVAGVGQIVRPPVLLHQRHHDAGDGRYVVGAKQCTQPGVVDRNRFQFGGPAAHGIRHRDIVPGINVGIAQVSVAAVAGDDGG